LLRSKGMDLVIELLKDKEGIEKELGSIIEFHYINYGAERSHYCALLETISGTVRHEPYPISRMVEFYNEFDILLFPSLRAAESLGLVAIEAMSCDSPVIATDAYAFVETVVEGISGERFQTQQPQAFRAALVRCAQNLSSYEPRRFVLGRYGKKVVSHNYAKLLNDVL
jgi:glycosyltransferase involved in cell wall biosynthesis